MSLLFTVLMVDARARWRINVLSDSATSARNPFVSQSRHMSAELGTDKTARAETRVFSFDVARPTRRGTDGREDKN
jgi:hypothetical protein